MIALSKQTDSGILASDLESGSTARVLLAGFDQSAVSVLNSCVQAAGFFAVLAKDGLVAWELLQTQTPRLVLLEAELPGLSCAEIVRRIRGSRPLADLPIILLGGPISTEERVEWFKRGADEYVSKPFSTRILTAQMRALVRRVARRK